MIRDILKKPELVEFHGESLHYWDIFNRINEGHSVLLYGFFVYSNLGEVKWNAIKDHFSGRK